MQACEVGQGKMDSRAEQISPIPSRGDPIRDGNFASGRSGGLQAAVRAKGSEE